MTQKISDQENDERELHIWKIASRLFKEGLASLDGWKLNSCTTCSHKQQCNPLALPIVLLEFNDDCTMYHNAKNRWVYD